jgi:hypothetical protein
MKTFATATAAAKFYTDAKMSPYNDIKKETQKAVLIEAAGLVWLPKSQIQMRKIDGLDVVIMPGWLFWKNAESFRNSHGQLVVSDCADYMDKLF